MKNIVLDTNCLLNCLAAKSKYHAVWTAFLNEDFQLCVSNEILNEYEEILAKKTSTRFADMIMNVLVNSENLVLVHPTFRFNLIAIDPDDNKFVDCAIVANADYIVSQDAHFDILKKIDFPNVNVIRIEDFVTKLNGSAYKNHGSDKNND
jgi:putative PIN family toxin of toxin-antitoxin system